LWRTRRLDIPFSNAEDTSEEELDQVIATNVKSAFLLSKYAIPIMAEAGGGGLARSG